MKIPEGKIVTRDVRGEFASPENVVAYLGKKQFTGYLCARHGAQKDFILFRKGKVWASLESIGHGFRVIPHMKVLERAGVSGDLSIGELASEISAIAEIILSGRKLYENLNTAFTRLRPFLITLGNEGRSCVVEVANEKNYGCILLRGGTPSGAFLFVETQYLEGAQALSSLLNEIDRETHSITVYEGDADEGKI